MNECYDCGDPAKHSDLDLPGDMRCDECHLAYLAEKANKLVDMIRKHIDETGLEFDIMDVL